MNILLISPLDRDFMPPAMPPLGLAYIASALIEVDHNVTVIDLNSDRENGINNLKEVLRKKEFEMIGISSIITQYKKVKTLAQLIKSINNKPPLVMGGPGPTSSPYNYLKYCQADIICMGEGEETVKQLASILKQGSDLKDCNGIIYKNTEGKIVQTKVRLPINDLNKIKKPCWEKLELFGIYVENFLFKHGRDRGMCVFSTRGCPGRCNYCMCNFGRKTRMRSIQDISEEIEDLVDEHQVNHIHFIDDTFITSPKRTREICARFQSDFKDITWSANVRADFVKPELLKLMGKSNCISLAYGIESGSSTVLKYMKKGVSVEQASNAIKWTREAGIDLVTYFMIGMPCETKETVRQTVRFCKENLVGWELFFATPFPGTDLYNYALEKKLIINENLYLEHCGEVRNFLINLTNMTNEELFTLREEAENEIRNHLIKNGYTVKYSTREDPRETTNYLPHF